MTSRRSPRALRSALSLVASAAAVLALAACTQAAPTARGSTTAAGTESSALGYSALLSAPIPALCGRPAGSLVKGRLPVTVPNTGDTTLDDDALAAASSNDASTIARLSTASIATGTGAGRASSGVSMASIAAVVRCSQGNGDFPDTIVFWDARMHMVAAAPLVTWTPGFSAQTQDVTAVDGGFRVRWIGGAADEPHSGPTESAEATFTVTGSRAVANDFQLFDGSQAVEDDIAAAQASNAAAIVGTDDARTQLAVLVEHKVAFDPGTASCSGSGGQRTADDTEPLVQCTVDTGAGTEASPSGGMSFTLAFAGWNDYQLVTVGPATTG